MIHNKQVCIKLKDTPKDKADLSVDYTINIRSIPNSIIIKPCMVHK